MAEARARPARPMPRGIWWRSHPSRRCT